MADAKLQRGIMITVDGLGVVVADDLSIEFSADLDDAGQIQVAIPKVALYDALAEWLKRTATMIEEKNAEER